MKSFIVNFDSIRNENASLEGYPVGFIANAIVKGELTEYVAEDGEDPVPVLVITVPGFIDYLSILTEHNVTSLTVDFNALEDPETLFIHASGENPK